MTSPQLELSLDLEAMARERSMSEVKILQCLRRRLLRLRIQTKLLNLDLRLRIVPEAGR